MRKKISIILIIVLPILLIFSIFGVPTGCSSDWHITGYYTPNETQFKGPNEEIFVDGKSEFYKSDFIKEIKTEGWGKTANGKYLGWYDNKFHLENNPLDYNGDELKIKAVAADLSVLPLGSQITIPDLPEPWGTYTFHVADVGPSINEKHIDVYTGEGNNARIITEKITSNRQNVCIIS
jgi:3D (Asp-Asp-Asp) domain-containing protein